jgi:hypothetical protein
MLTSLSSAGLHKKLSSAQNTRLKEEKIIEEEENMQDTMV